MKAIFKRELSSYFNSPLIYIILSVFLVISTLFFMMYNMLGASPDLYSVFYSMNTILLFLVPMITMRLFSEEKTQKTDQLLLTSPNTITSVVMGKFLSALVVYWLMISVTILFAIIIAMFTNFDFKSFFVLYTGAILMGAAFISVGLFISSAIGNILTSALATFGLLMVFYYAEMIPLLFGRPEFLTKIFSFFSLSARFDDFIMGLLSLDGIIYYLSFAGVFVFLTIRVIDKKRWS